MMNGARGEKYNVEMFLGHVIRNFGTIIQNFGIKRNNFGVF
jgi:hypothetical protein